jgi:nicotinamidase-related amidase
MTRKSRWMFVIALAAVLSGCESMQSMSSTGASEIPPTPSPVAVSPDARSTALLVLDFNTAVCQPRPACIEVLPRVAQLIAKARAANVPVLYSTTPSPKGPNPTLDAVAPRAGEPVVAARADKFLGTNMEELLKQRKVQTLVIAGTAANGAVLYSAYHANALGFTVAVAQDAVSSATPYETTLALFQLLHQPGVGNEDNKPLAPQRVTLTRSDLVTFK